MPRLMFRLPNPILNLCALALLAGLMQPALALVKMDAKAIDAALVYGMRNKKASLSTLLGPNWVDGGDGTLLNIYSPFMALAAKAAKGNFSSNPTPTDLKKARERFGREVAFYSDPKNRLQVKFAVSFYGKTPDFAKTYVARIEGFGRGKAVSIKPAKILPDLLADPVPNDPTLYEAVNSYYFNFSDLENLQEFRLVMESPTGEPVTFRLNNERLY